MYEACKKFENSKTAREVSQNSLYKGNLCSVDSAVNLEMPADYYVFTWIYII